MSQIYCKALLPMLFHHPPSTRVNQHDASSQWVRDHQHCMLSWQAGMTFMDEKGGVGWDWHQPVPLNPNLCVGQYGLTWRLSHLHQLNNQTRDLLAVSRLTRGKGTNVYFLWGTSSGCLAVAGCCLAIAAPMAARLLSIGLPVAKSKNSCNQLQFLTKTLTNQQCPWDL